MIFGETSGPLIGKCGCEGCPLKEKMNGGNVGDFDGGCRVRRMPSEREKCAGGQAGKQMGGKVAEIDFFEVGNHAKNEHLSKDKRTKFSDKVFVLKKTSTE